MFDDQIQNPGQVPGNLPTSDKEPEDIFSGTEVIPPAVLDEATEGEDAVPPAKPASPTALSAGILRPKSQETEQLTVPPATIQTATPTQAPSPVMPPGTPAQEQVQMDYQVKAPSVGKGLFTIVIIVVVLAILGGGGWFIYSNFISESGTKDDFKISEPETVVPIEQEEANNLMPTGEGEDIVNEIEDEQILFGEPIDRDGDGLDDEREITIGTDPDNWDTDGDELGDGDEVLSWETDPLDPDTDNDGYLDGAEIKNGYSPTGPGKLFEAPVNEGEIGNGGSTAPTTNTEGGV